MALGLQAQTNDRYYTIRLIEGAAAATGRPPDGSAAGDDDPLQPDPTPDEFFDLRSIAGNFKGAFPTPCQVLVYNTAGTNVVSVTYVKLWGYNITSGRAFPLGAGADADRGKLNNGGSVGEVDTDDVRLAEVVLYLGLWDGIQAEVGVTAGTGSEAFNVDLLIPLSVV
jgi:hypothetical protein